MASVERMQGVIRTSEPARKRFKTSDLPLSSIQRSSIDELLHTIKKKGEFDRLRKQVWSRYAEGTAKADFVAALNNVAEAEIENEPTLLSKTRGKAATLVEGAVDRSNLYKDVEASLDALIAEHVSAVERAARLIRRQAIGSEAADEEEARGRRTDEEYAAEGAVQREIRQKARKLEDRKRRREEALEALREQERQKKAELEHLRQAEEKRKEDEARAARRKKEREARHEATKQREKEREAERAANHEKRKQEGLDGRDKEREREKDRDKDREYRRRDRDRRSRSRDRRRSRSPSRERRRSRHRGRESGRTRDRDWEDDRSGRDRDHDRTRRRQTRSRSRDRRSPRRKAESKAPADEKALEEAALQLLLREGRELAAKSAPLLDPERSESLEPPSRRSHVAKSKPGDSTLKPKPSSRSASKPHPDPRSSSTDRAPPSTRDADREPRRSHEPRRSSQRTPSRSRSRSRDRDRRARRSARHRSRSYHSRSRSRSRSPAASSSLRPPRRYEKRELDAEGKEAWKRAAARKRELEAEEYKRAAREGRLPTKARVAGGSGGGESESKSVPGRSYDRAKEPVEIDRYVPSTSKRARSRARSRDRSRDRDRDRDRERDRERDRDRDRDRGRETASSRRYHRDERDTERTDKPPRFKEKIDRYVPGAAAEQQDDGKKTSTKTSTSTKTKTG